MNPKTANLLAFSGGVLAGIALDFLAGGAPVKLFVLSFIVGFSLLVFGAPHRNPRAGYFGWGALGLSAGIMAPFALIYMLMAG